MRRKLCSTAALAVMIGFGSSGQAVAHQGHTSCRGGVSDLAKAGLAGETASSQAEGGLDEEVAAGHAALCQLK